MIKLGIVMDSIESINIKKDSSFAMLLEAQARQWPIYYMQMGDLVINDNLAMASMRRLTVWDNAERWYQCEAPEYKPLSELDVVLMRKDPPYDMEYVYATHILESAQSKGVLVVNDPRALRDANEKLFTHWFPQCTTEMMVSRRIGELLTFLKEHSDIIVKPLDGMGGANIFRLRQGDVNTNVILETITHNESRFVMAQQFIADIVRGDKRILLIDGEPVPYALARIPKEGETRGNLAAGGRGEGVELSDRDYWICNQLAPELKRRGLLFVGIDVIGDYLTEVNVTSPTCIRELDALYNLNISAKLMDVIERKRQENIAG